MRKGPLLPFGIIMILGVLTMLLLSFKGVGDSKELAAQIEGGGEQAEQVAKSPEEIYQSSCITCHGDQYQGSGNSPALTGVGDRLSKEEIEDVIVNGRNGMPGGLVLPDEVSEMTEWLSEL